MSDPLVFDADYSGDRAPDMTVRLTFEQRSKARLRVQTGDGQAIGLFVERGRVLRGGSRLTGPAGKVLQIDAAPEKVSLVRADASSTDPRLDLTRAAYHLGNRHVALQVEPEGLVYQADRVLDEMVAGLGLAVEQEEAPFEPEAGAYSSHDSHGSRAHSHSHDHNAHS